MAKLFLDCSGGARKEGVAAALFGLLDSVDRARVLEKFSSIGIDGAALKVSQNGESYEAVITVNGNDEAHRPHNHEHRTPGDVGEILSVLNIDYEARQMAANAYAILAMAEAKAHEASIADIHFHEVGNDYAILYVALACQCASYLAPEETVCSPIATGFGFIDCAHGRLAIPAPATANIIDGLPAFPGDVEGELTTPSGAAIVRALTTRFEVDPAAFAPGEKAREAYGAAQGKTGATRAILK